VIGGEGDENTDKKKIKMISGFGKEKK